MKIKTQNLAAALKLAACVSGRAMPILACVRLHAQDGVLSIMSTDMNQIVSVSVECVDNLPPICVSQRQLTEFATIADNEIEFKLEDNGRLSLSAGVVVKIPTLDAAVFPSPPTETRIGIGVNCEDLSKSIHQVKWAASRDKTRESLQSVHIIGTPKMLITQGSTGRELAQYCLPAICSEFDMIIPDEFLGNLCAHLECDGAEFHAGKNSVFVKHNSGSYSCKLFDGQYPAFDAVINRKAEPIGVIDRDEWLQAVKAIVTICPTPPAGESALSAEVAFRPKFAIIKSSRGTFDFEKKIAGKFTDSSISINVESAAKCLTAFPPESTIKVASSVDMNLVSFEAENLKVVAAQYQSGGK